MLFSFPLNDVIENIVEVALISSVDLIFKVLEFSAVAC